MVLQLEIAEYLQGGFSLAFVVISIVLGATILSKYSEFKRREFILIGLSLMGIANPWLGDAINFILIWFDTTLPWVAYFVIANAFLPGFVFCWLFALTEFKEFKENQKIVLSAHIILITTFEVVFFIFLAADTKNLIGDPQGPFVVYWSAFIEVYLLISIVIVLITGLLFARESLKSDKSEIKLKGKFLIAAVVIFTAAALVDSQTATLSLPMEITIIIIVIVRVVLMFSSILFYIGFIMPETVKRRLLKEENY
jgi:MFS family permease